MKKLILFDIDGTLLRAKRGLSKQLFAQFLSQLLSKDVTPDILPDFAGNTDINILSEALDSLGEDADYILGKGDDIWKLQTSVFKSYSNTQHYIIYPGVLELLNYLQNYKSNYSLALLTGNNNFNAYNKLSIFDLESFFPTGAFGNDARERSDLPPIAFKRSMQVYEKTSFNSSNSIIIGDSFRDVKCALDNRMAVIAVATGDETEEQLRSHGATYTVENLADTKFVLDILAEF